MKNCIIMCFAIISILGCQDLNQDGVTPQAPAKSNFRVNNKRSQVSARAGTSQIILSESDVELLIRNYERTSKHLSRETILQLVQTINEIIPIVQSLDDQTPLSLRQDPSNWRSIIEEDEQAKAYALKVRERLDDEFGNRVEQPVLASCDNWSDFVFSIFMCIKLEQIICKWAPEEGCWGLITVERMIECIYDSCLLD